MPDQLDGVHSLVRIESHPEERSITLWIKAHRHKASTNEMRILARHILEQADATDTEANRKRRFFEESAPVMMATEKELQNAVVTEGEKEPDETLDV